MEGSSLLSHRSQRIAAYRPRPDADTHAHAHTSTHTGGGMNQSSKHACPVPRARSGRGRGGKSRPVKPVQIIRKVEYSSSLREEEPTTSEGGAGGAGGGEETKKKCILLIVKKNKDDVTEDAPPKRPRMTVRMTVEPTLAPLAPPAPRKGRYVKVRKEALQALPELRELIKFHRNKHAELIQENQLYDSTLSRKLSLPGVFGEGPSPSHSSSALPSTFQRPQKIPRPEAVPQPPARHFRPPPILPKGPGYLLALRQESLRGPELWPQPLPQSVPASLHVAPPPPKRASDSKENFPMRRMKEPKSIMYEEGNGTGSPPYPKLPVFEVRAPSLIDYENVTVLGEECLEPPLERVSDSRAKKVLEEFDLLNSPEPQSESVDSGYVPNCPELDFASLEIVRGETVGDGDGLDPSNDSQDPFLEEIFQVLRREVFDPFQQPPTTLDSGSDVRGS